MEVKSKYFYLVGILLLLVLLYSQVMAQAYYDFDKVQETTETCLACHDDVAEGLTATPHQLMTEKVTSAKNTVGCISCHEGWEKHIDDPSVETIVNLTQLSVAEQADVCSRCHVTSHQQAMISTDPHYRSDIGCLSCHTVHNNHVQGLLKDDRENFCLKCHTDVSAQFMLRSNHPLHQSDIRCIDCHDLDQNKDPLMATGLNWKCQGCHSDVAGPYLYEHPVTYQHLVEGVGCTECHRPHGSPNDRLLTQPGNGVCLQCHGTPPGHRTRHSGLGTKLACVDCHSEIHGSYDNNKFLDPDLGVKLFPDCFQSGCHIVNK